ncbi:hypothetical protein OLZ31_02330 [Enterobacter asburiae]|nr:hypothetical protein [Enterobacter asburiae]
MTTGIIPPADPRGDILGFILPRNPGDDFLMLDPYFGILEFDVVEQEPHDWTRDITTNPVEGGSPIADHIIRQPKKLSVTGMISNTPVRGIISRIEGEPPKDNVREAIALLENFYNSNELLTVYTRDIVYENMLITSISIPRRTEDGTAINFSMDFQQVNIVTTATTKLPPGIGVGKDGKSNAKDKATKNRATGTKNAGKAAAEIAGPPEYRSRAYDMVHRTVGDYTHQAPQILPSLGF